MKLIFDSKEYEISEESFKAILGIIGKMIFIADMPEEIKQSYFEINDFSVESLYKLTKIAKETLSYGYNKIPTPIKIACIGLYRAIFFFFEMKVNNSAITSIFRAPKRKDPIEHMISILCLYAESAIEVAHEEIASAAIKVTTEDNTVTSVVFSTGEVGATLVANGEYGKREDDSRKNDRLVAEKAVS